MSTQKKPKKTQQKTEGIGITNFYQTLPSKYKVEDGIKYDNYDKIRIKCPFRMLIIGSSGSGKTVVAMNLINLMSCFTRIYLFARQLDEPLYKWLIESMQQVGKKLKKNVIFYSNSIDDIPPIEAFDKEESNLIIFDDMVTEAAKKQKHISDLYISGRKKMVSCIYISQNYYGVPNLIRKNADYIILKKIGTKRDLTSIVKEYNLGASVDGVMRLYKHIVSKDFTNFLLIDTNTNDERYRFRENFEPVALPQE